MRGHVSIRSWDHRGETTGTTADDRVVHERTMRGPCRGGSRELSANDPRLLVRIWSVVRGWAGVRYNGGLKLLLNGGMVTSNSMQRKLPEELLTSNSIERKSPEAPYRFIQ